MSVTWPLIVAALLAAVWFQGESHRAPYSPAQFLPLPAMLKRVVLVDMADVDPEGFVRRIGHIDLMAIADPDGVARLETDAARDLAGVFTFPFFTIEDVMLVDDRHILVANDNNLPFSSGRELDAAAANEVILLEVAEFLAAK